MVKLISTFVYWLGNNWCSSVCSIECSKPINSNECLLPTVGIIKTINLVEININISVYRWPRFHSETEWIDSENYDETDKWRTNHLALLSIDNNNKTEDAMTTRGARNLTDLNVHNYYAFERVPEFKYVSRTIINDRNNTHERIPRSVNRFSFFSNLLIFQFLPQKPWERL